MNIQRLFTFDGPVFVNVDNIASGRKIIPLFTSDGQRLSIHGRTRKIREKAELGVHVDNLYASLDLALSGYEKKTNEFLESLKNG